MIVMLLVFASPNPSTMVKGLFLAAQFTLTVVAAPTVFLTMIISSVESAVIAPAAVTTRWTRGTIKTGAIDAMSALISIEKAYASPVLTSNIGLRTVTTAGN